MIQLVIFYVTVSFRVQLTEQLLLHLTDLLHFS